MKITVEVTGHDKSDEKILIKEITETVNGASEQQESCRSTRQQILEQAIKYICQDRNNSYGEPEDSFASIADLWNVYLWKVWDAEGALMPHDVAVMMTLLKIARIMGNPEKIDNWVDLAGYAACGGECADKRNFQ